MVGIRPRRDIYVSVAGTDLVRLPDGRFAVLEDNLRVPSGVSYMLTNRQIIKRVFPELFTEYSPCGRSTTTGWRCSRRCDRSRRTTEPNPTIVLLTPGVFNSAYFEHTFLARQMGIELVEGRDLMVHDNVVYMRTTAGLRRVDVIYRRVDDDFIDPLAFRSDSRLGVPGLFNAYRAGQRVDRQRHRHRRRRRQGGVRVRAGDHQVLSRRGARFCPTCRPTCSTTRAIARYVLEHLDELVVKAVGESGGYGMLIGPHSTAEQREEFRRRISADPRNYIAQPTLALSRAPSFINDQIALAARRSAPVCAVRRDRAPSFQGA